MNAEDPMETEQSSMQDDQGTPMDYEEQAIISKHRYLLAASGFYILLISQCATTGGETERVIKTA